MKILSISSGICCNSEFLARLYQSGFHRIPEYLLFLTATPISGCPVASRTKPLIVNASCCLLTRAVFACRVMPAVLLIPFVLGIALAPIATHGSNKMIGNNLRQIQLVA